MATCCSTSVVPRKRSRRFVERSISRLAVAPRNYLAQRLRLIGDDSDAVMLLRVSQDEDPRQIQTIAALGPALIGAGRYKEAKALADSVIAAEQAPPMMVQMSRIADSAMKVNAPSGSIRIGVPPTARLPSYIDGATFRVRRLQRFARFSARAARHNSHGAKHA